MQSKEHLDIRRNILRSSLVNREDIVPILTETYITVIKANYNDLLFTHTTNIEIDSLEKFLSIPINGKIGTYVPKIDNTTVFACIDFDGSSHTVGLMDAKNAVIQTYYAFKQHGLESHIEISSSGTGYHLWVLFTESISAIQARALCYCLCPTNLLLNNGEAVILLKTAGIEIYPKSNVIRSPKGLGSQIWLPFASTSKYSYFCELKDNDLIQYTPEKLAKNTIEQVNTVLNRFGGVTEIFKDQQHFFKITPPNTNEESTVWKQWRKNALEKLKLSQVYHDIITENNTENSEWVECRDPWSPSGDQNPSAGISTGTKEYEKGLWHSFRTGETLSVFDYIRKCNKCTDIHLDACKFISNLTQIPIPTQEQLEINVEQQANNNNEQNELPVIRISNRQLIETVNDSWQAIQRYNNHESQPRLFVKGGHLTEINFNNGSKIPSLSDINTSRMYGLLARSARWVKLNNRGRMVSCSPDKDISADMLVSSHEVKNQIPKIEYIITTPIFAPNLELVVKNGYSKSAKVWLHNVSELSSMSPIPIHPTANDIITAKQLLIDELYGNFPFVTSSDIAHTLSALFLPFVRQLIDGCTPLHLVEAPSPGTGKTKLCDLINIIFQGTRIESLAFPNTDDEVRKLITAELRRGRPIILFDNWPESKKITSAVLSKVLTDMVYSDRILGESRNEDMPNYALWIATANNPSLSMELARRCIRIRLDAKIDQPWKRSGFKHAAIEDWALTNRAKLIHSILTCVQSWVSNGCPAGKNTLGSFERWASVMGGILDTIGVKGFLGNLDELYEQADTEGNELRQFIMRWAVKYGERRVTIEELLNLCNEYMLMSSVLGDVSQNVRNRKLMLINALRIARDRVIGNFKLEVSHDPEMPGGCYKITNVVSPCIPSNSPVPIIVNEPIKHENIIEYN